MLSILEMSSPVDNTFLSSVVECCPLPPHNSSEYIMSLGCNTDVDREEVDFGYGSMSSYHTEHDFMEEWENCSTCYQSAHDCES